VAVVNFMNDEG
jgi:hypothetical protein